MSLQSMLQRDAGIAAITQHLDALSHAARLDELYALDRDGQRALYERAAAAPPITLEHFVPPGWPTRLPVHHLGKNTLPAPGPLRRFQKRFARPEHGDCRLFGYNEGPTRRLIGPGYFVAVPTGGDQRGAVVVDYVQVPDGPVPEGWPAVIPNRQGPQRLVYFETRDYMRKLSEHASIGAAYKRERALDHYFILCREP
jgi:hypothetical protein